MGVRQLPRRPSLEYLRNESRELQRGARRGDPEALAFLAQHHLRGKADTLTSVQLAVARSYGFASWPKLREHVETINRYFWPPVEAGSDDEDLDLVERFLAYACLTYTGVDARQRPRDAEALLDANPEIATASVHAMAATNEADALRAAIATDPTLVARPGGPHRWVPLLYAAYARIPERSTLEAARVLLDAGADPNAGSLWDGTYPFTALTGVLGGGEERQPRHLDGLAFARLLLEAGANPNDTQAIYNGTFLPDNSHLELLFEFGLGTGDPGPWAARLGPRAATVADYLQLNLEWAAQHGFVERVRLLLDHGVDPNGKSHYHAEDGRSPYEMAEVAGNRESAELLLAAGAEPRRLDPLERFVAACMRADRAEVEATQTDELVRMAEQTHAPLSQAAALGRRDAVRLMLDIGFDINAPGCDTGVTSADHGGTALHEAVFADAPELVEMLLARGADSSIRDPEWHGTAADWARYAGNDELAHVIEERSPGCRSRVYPADAADR
jgi:ankyrin repeat protein